MKNEIVKANINESQLKEAAHLALTEAKRLGAHQAEIDVAANKGFTVVARSGDVETVEYNQDKVIDVTVYFGKRSGSASLSDMRPEAIKQAVEAAVHIAKFTDEDPAAGLPDKSELAFNYPTLSLAHAWPITVEKAIELAIDCEREALAQDKRIISAESVSVATTEVFNLYANSLGFMGYYPETRHDISCVLVAKEGDDMQRDYSYTTAANPSLLKSTSFVAKEAAERVIKRLGAKQLATAKVPVIFYNEEARGLLGSFVAAISGGNLYRKASFLVDHLGKRIFPDFVHLQEFPFLTDALGSAPFDADGVATRENVFVDDGILQSYVLGVYSARKLGMKTTGNAGGIHNLTIRPGDKDLSALMKTMGKGLLITEMMGSGANLVTGDYSRGAAGFWVENGEIQFPVHEITVAGKLQAMFSQLVEVGSDVDMRGNIRTGSLLIEEMVVAGS